MIYDSYGTRLEKESFGNISNRISYDDFKNVFPLKFNVLISDCEGCFCDFIYMIGNDINNYNKILLEADQTHMCDYNLILDYLKNVGFKIVKNDNNFRYVLIK